MSGVEGKKGKKRSRQEEEDGGENKKSKLEDEQEKEPALRTQLDPVGGDDLSERVQTLGPLGLERLTLAGGEIDLVDLKINETRLGTR